MQLDNQEKWLFVKNKVKELNHANEEAMIPYLKEILQLLNFVNQNDIQQIFGDNYSFFMDDFFNSISKQLLLTCKQTQEILDLNNQVLSQIIQLFLKTFKLQNSKLYESFVLILDPRRNYHKFQNQDVQICQHLNFLNKNNSFMSSVKINQKVDAIYVNKDFIQWQQAKIVKIKQNKIKVQYLDESERWIYRDSGEIDKFGQNLIDFEIDQNIHYYSNQQYWVEGKIIKIENHEITVKQNNENESIETFHVCSCRFLPQEYKYCLNQYDEIEDNNDIILKNNKQLVIGRESYCQSKFLINEINKIEPYINDMIEAIKNTTSIEFIKSLIQFFENINKLVLKSQANQIYDKLQKATIFASIQISQNNVRNQQTLIIENINNSLNSLLQRVYTQEQKSQILMQFQLEIILIYLNSNYLDRQIQALKLLQDIQKYNKTNSLLVINLILGIMDYKKQYF